MTGRSPGDCPGLDIEVEKRGARSVLVRQYARYPFHLTRPFRLDPAPEATTLYIQSASGGLYADEVLRMCVRVGAGASLHLTTQAATLVHGHRGRPARVEAEFRVEDGGSLFYTPDPQILLPGSHAVSTVALRLEGSAAAFLSDGFLLHDPAGKARSPVSYNATVEVDRDGTQVLRDRQVVRGAELAAADGPMHGYAVCGTMMILSRQAESGRDALDAALREGRSLAGITPLPNAGGLGLRVLSPDGTAFASVLEAAFAAAFTERHGVVPARRRK